MNKTIIINISGTIFHIEEEAYDVLRTYMSSVKRYFGDSQDSFEIVTDIENRIAELFTEILKEKSAQVVVGTDVNRVIGQMGSPQDFLDEEKSENQNSGFEKQAPERRKLYRDTEDKVLGGVCSGLSYYFGIDAVWIRVFFALLFWVGGFTVMAYIVLWIAMPPAKTRAEKLSMAGEKVNLENIKNAVQSELEDVQDRMKKYGNDLRSGAASARIGEFVEEFASLAFRLWQVVGKILLIVLGVLALFFSISLLFTAAAFIVALIIHPGGSFFGDANGPVYLDLSPGTLLLSGIALSLAIAIPALLLFAGGLRMIVNRRIMNGMALRTLLVIWFFSIVGCAWAGVNIARLFSEEASITQEVKIKNVASNTYYLKPADGQESDSTYSKDIRTSGRFNWHIKLGGRNNRNRVWVDIEKQDTGRATVQEVFNSRGGSLHDALRNADRIKYRFQQKDSVLIFPKGLPNYGEAFRFQSARVILKIPVGTTVVADPDFETLNLPQLDEYVQVEGKNNIFIMTESGLKPKFLVHKKTEQSDEN